MALSKSQAKRILNSLAFIQEEGPVVLQRSGPATYFEGEEHEPARYLLGFKATTPDKARQAKEMLAERGEEDDCQDIVNVATLSYGQNVPYSGGTPWIPKQREFVNAEIGTVDNRDGEAVLRIIDISEREAKRVQTAAGFFDDDEEGEAEEATEGEENLSEASS